MSLRFQAKRTTPILSRLFRRTYIANVCGHETHQEHNGRVRDKALTMGVPLAHNGEPDFCVACVTDMSIRCARCGKPIVVGDIVTLHVPAVDFEVPDFAVWHQLDEKRQALVGCLRRDCVELGVNVWGRWQAPGEVQRFVQVESHT